MMERGTSFIFYFQGKAFIYLNIIKDRESRSLNEK
jgi:hypothetical protein